MKNTLLIPFFALLAFAGCTDHEDESFAGENTGIRLLPARKPNEVIDKRIFERINLDYPGLEKVKEYYDNNEYYYAVNELLTYYRTRTGIYNPAINLMNPSITAFDLNVANQALERRFYVRNFKESEAGGKEVYYAFDKNGKIDWEFIPAGVTDQEFAIQKHRHQWMLPQAMAYRAGRDERHVLSWIEVYSDWLKAYPAPEGTIDGSYVPWQGLQTAERVLSQIDIMACFIQSVNFTPEWLSYFLTVFADEVECIRNNYYTDGSNIYATQVQAVAKAAILMPECKNAAKWMEEGAQRMAELIDGQFLEDGVQNELDPSYHIATVAGFYDIYQTARLNNKLSLFPADYSGQLKKAARFVMDIVYPDYTIDNFNDTRSSSYTKNVLLRNFRQYVEMFPDDAELKWMATEGREGQKPLELTRAYTTSGYYMLRDGWGKNSTVMILKNNHNPDNKWHCQPDNGTFGLYRNGRNFCPDAGVYSYGGSKESNADRAAFRATKMHNTMTRNNATIANGYMKGKFLKLESRNGVDILVTENRSYSDLTHRRAVFFVNKEFFVLVDEGYGTGSSPLVNLNLNLCPTKDDVVIDDNTAAYQYGAHTAFADNNNMLFKTFVETTTDYSAINNTAYISSKLQEKTAQRRFYQVTTRKPADGAARFITVIHPFGAVAGWESLAIEAKFTDNAGGTPGAFHENGASVEVTVNNRTHKLSYTLND